MVLYSLYEDANVRIIEEDESLGVCQQNINYATIILAYSIFDYSDVVIL